jgi:hypothetical protein
MSIFDFFKSKKPRPFFETMFGAPDAAQTDKIADAVGEYGLCPTNPIPVSGIAMIAVYFRRLITDAGQMVRVDRARSVYDLPNVKHPVDEYNVSDVDGNFLTKMYVVAYHGKLSDKAPRGFRLAVKNGWSKDIMTDEQRRAIKDDLKKRFS